MEQVATFTLRRQSPRDLAFVEQGNHVLMTGAAYEPTQEFCNALLKGMGVSNYLL